ncbi:MULTISPECIES: hypothetical protein [unclassified Arthrobacter]|uniref:hypothetical protein n=1 Tax=unclassified Arthrobacter TaxID=235627 RepID=UPI002E09B7F5|nr:MULTISPECIES: hypothetical protein [unclassified Arthrobacter]MEC5193063.1 protein-S-isoprenylcysteine O-methyltransferase Ste14 [Arthrobacter sp. MP_M4]MEC5204682.1 protein-S-isoprenylcysteine O-methyltransferase Ste14 [Arthrobacter sp. MP_M7]
MSAALVIKLLIIVFVSVALAGGVWWMRKHPNRSKKYPEQLRMPKIVPIVGWLFLGVGLLMGLVAFSLDDARDPVGFRIASAAIVLGGLVFLIMYHNWYVAPRADEVAFRGLLGKEHVLPYHDIAEYRRLEMNRQPLLTIKSIHGVKLSLNTRIYDMTPLLRAIDFHQATGRWPGRGELTPAQFGADQFRK